MITIKKMLSTTGLLQGRDTVYSIACISTSRPIYLIFDETDDYPLYAVRRVIDANGFRACKLSAMLYQFAGNLVPEPIGVYEHAGENFDVQRGIRGFPWFQLKAKIHTDHEQELLEDRIWETLRSFQTAIQSMILGQTVASRPAVELRNASKMYIDTGEILTKNLEYVLTRALNNFSEETSCAFLPQHGDFCINNLIIDKNHITVIDFEDFSITEMPMYDHFTLALSLPSYGSNPRKAANVFRHGTIISEAHLLGIKENAVRWHFLHHLLLRLGPWSDVEKRQNHRNWLKRVLEYFLEEQNSVV
jgi:hypothetical protein